MNTPTDVKGAAREYSCYVAAGNHFTSATRDTTRLTRSHASDAADAVVVCSDALFV